MNYAPHYPCLCIQQSFILTKDSCMPTEMITCFKILFLSNVWFWFIPCELKLNLHPPWVQILSKIFGDLWAMVLATFRHPQSTSHTSKYMHFASLIQKWLNTVVVLFTTSFLSSYKCSPLFRSHRSQALERQSISGPSSFSIPSDPTSSCRHIFYPISCPSTGTTGHHKPWIFGLEVRRNLVNQGIDKHWNSHLQSAEWYQDHEINKLKDKHRGSQGI